MINVAVVINGAREWDWDNFDKLRPQLEGKSVCLWEIVIKRKYQPLGWQIHGPCRSTSANWKHQAKTLTRFILHTPLPNLARAAKAFHSFVPLGSLNFPAIFCDGGGYVETRFPRSHARKRKKPLRQELLSMDTTRSSTTNKTLKLYAENQPKALLISKETL